MIARGLAALLVVAALAGCGGGAGHPTTAAATPTTAARTTAAKVAAASCTARQRAKALARLTADVAAIRAAAKLPTKSALDGNAAINRATDRFLEDVQTAPVDNIARNRLIDHAAAALVGACEQCFQALEANRPIPAIAHGDRGACAKP